VADPSTGGDATGGDAPATGDTPAPADNGDSGSSTPADPVTPVTPVVPADPSTPSGGDSEPETPAEPAQVEPSALGLIQSIIDDIGEFERHAVHSVISFIERLAPHHQKAIVDHFANKQ
jgi:hypothetical protein